MQLIDPLTDDRWNDLAARHPRASAFHQRGWLTALQRTYGYTPQALTHAAAGQALEDGVVFCRVSSWITGTRAVSLPFADHCDPLVGVDGESTDFVNWLRAERERAGWKYFELRPLPGEKAGCGLDSGRSYCFHELDLTSGVETIFRNLHKNSIQRKIQRAEKEGLAYEAGRSPQLVSEFYRLLVKTRKRHRLLPQPRAWFDNLVECMGDNIAIRVARKDGVAVAAMLTLRHGATVTYKYGCSDERRHNLGGMPFLFWRLIEESKVQGMMRLDLGRSDLDNPGLITFKDRLGAQPQPLTYYRDPPAKASAATGKWQMRPVRQLLSILPDALSSAAGSFVYRHVG